MKFAFDFMKQFPCLRHSLPPAVAQLRLDRPMRALIVLLVTCGTALGSTHYTEAMFHRAMAQYNGSVTESGQPLPTQKDGSVQIRTGMSSLYVLVTVQYRRSLIA